MINGEQGVSQSKPLYQLVLHFSLFILLTFKTYETARIPSPTLLNRVFIGNSAVYLNAYQMLSYVTNKNKPKMYFSTNKKQ